MASAELACVARGDQRAAAQVAARVDRSPGRHAQVDRREILDLRAQAFTGRGRQPQHAAGQFRVDPEQFIEEVGKAGKVKLTDLAQPAVLARMVAGTPVNLEPRESGLVVTSPRDEYLGLVEARHGQRLLKMMERGNRYSANIVKSQADGVVVIVREVYQDPSQVGRLPFPPKGNEGLLPDVSDRIIRREMEYEESLPSDSGYTIIGGDEPEVLTEEPEEADDEHENEE